MGGGAVCIQFPYDAPLWYVFDLIIITFLLSPLIWLFLKKTKGYVLFFLALFYISAFWYGIPIRIDGIFYFSLGAYFAIYKINPIIKNKVLCLFALLFVVLAFCTYNIYVIGEICRKTYCILGTLTIWNLFAKVTNNLERYSSLARMVFFIYAIHEMYILNFVRILFDKINLFIGVNWALLLVEYFIAPILILTTCIFLYKLINSFAPKILSLYDGRR